MLGAVVGNYRITARLGAGGMGAVYLARHTLIGRQAAIKVLSPELSDDASAIDRFFRDARAVAGLSCPAIVDILDFGYHEHRAYLVMEYLEGESLRRRLDSRGAMEVSPALDIAREVARALAAAHDRGIAHCLLAPERLFLCPDPERAGSERVKILDFGLAALAAGGDVASRSRYAPPEQRARARGAADPDRGSAGRGSGPVGGDQRADLYALGAILYELLAGQPPGDGEPNADGSLPGLRARGVPTRTEAAIGRLIAVAPGQRFGSAAEAVEALDAAARDALGRSGSNRALSEEVAPSVSFTLSARTASRRGGEQTRPPAALRGSSRRPAPASASHEQPAAARSREPASGAGSAAPFRVVAARTRRRTALIALTALAVALAVAAAVAALVP